MLPGALAAWLSSWSLIWKFSLDLNASDALSGDLVASLLCKVPRVSERLLLCQEGPSLFTWARVSLSWDLQFCGPVNS